ncbi:MAG TPA: DUF721 domain-containing protein [Calditrichia bacterium]|nr:DUF721 domain-containing protein [Calditrichota bacterium]HQU70884.1 DUF721 domain-containing protein [Calditrichia bacterium]HQV31629.1 DUF721 domain-containing protein [Calditrichia bacterium]
MTQRQRTAHRGPQHIRQTIAAFLKAAGLKERFDENMAIAFWDSTVGETIAKFTEPRKVEKGMLMVKVTDNAWRTELMFHKFRIIKELNEKVGKAAIKDIKFY